MADIYLKNSFEEILSEIKNKKFFIFGNTRCANVFYLYCKEHGIEKNIEAFILSDISRDKRKIHKMHGYIPIHDIKWLKENKEIKVGFCGASQRLIEGELRNIFDEVDCSIFYVSNFVQDLMYYNYLTTSYIDIIKRYKTKNNFYIGGYINLYEDDESVYYKYLTRVPDGALPDNRIFGQHTSLSKLFKNQLGDYIILDNVPEYNKSELKCTIYTAKSHFDRELNEEYITPSTIEIQVGADLTKKSVSELKDNTGENISYRNQDYCEMTALYWAWKNDKVSDYIGLCHYRRRFVLDENIINCFMNEKYDAIYTIPLLTDGGMKVEFIDRNYFITPEMWELTGQSIKKLYPEYYSSWEEFENSFFLVSCNLLIMRRDIFDDYCTWAFSILEEVDKYYLSQGIQCNNRYLGYIAECLNTVYVMKNKEKLKKAFVEFKFLNVK